jgi:hypothetical protein
MRSKQYSTDPRLPPFTEKGRLCRAPTVDHSEPRAPSRKRDIVNAPEIMAYLSFFILW